MLKITITTNDLKSDVSIKGNNINLIDIVATYTALNQTLQETKDKFIEEVAENEKCSREKAEEIFNGLLERTRGIKLGGKHEKII